MHSIIHNLCVFFVCVCGYIQRKMCCIKIINFFNFKIEEKIVAVELRTTQCHTSAVKSEESQLLAWDKEWMTQIDLFIITPLSIL